jgi:hypothetical protein
MSITNSVAEVAPRVTRPCDALEAIIRDALIGQPWPHVTTIEL